MKILASILFLVAAGLVGLYSHFYSLWEVFRGIGLTVVVSTLIFMGVSAWETAEAAGDWDEEQDDNGKDKEE